MEGGWEGGRDKNEQDWLWVYKFLEPGDGINAGLLYFSLYCFMFEISHNKM